MTSDLSLLFNAEDEVRKIRLANGQIIESLKIGTAEVKDSDLNSLIIHNVLFVPLLEGNLLSVPQLTAEAYVSFHSDFCIIKDKNEKTLLTASRQGGFYVIGGEKRTEKAAVCQGGTLGINIWHKRLAHINYNYLKLMKKHNMVLGFSFKEENHQEPCKVCLKAKYNRKPFKDINCEQSKHPLELIHCDLIGPMPVKSIGGSLYILTIVDDYSRKMFPHFLKTKSETWEKLKDFILWANNNYEYNIKRLRSDRGTEFLNTNLRNVLKQNGIIHEYTSGYSPQSNGLAERANRSILEGVRALLIDSELPQQFWAEAAGTTAHIRNRTPCKVIYSLTPEERFSDKKPNLSHIKVFGSLCYYWLPQQKRSKLEARMAPGIFVGYSRNRRTYRVYEPESDTITETRDVVFYEKKRGSYLLHQLLKESESNPINEDKIVKIDLNIDKIEEEASTEPESQKETLISREARSSRKAVNYMESPNSNNQKFIDNTYLPSSEEEEEDLMFLSHQEEERLMLTMPENLNNGLVPTTYNEAMASPKAKLWNEAVQAELKALEQHHTWECVTLPKGANAIGCKWVFTLKPYTGNTVKYKARLVAKGCSQRGVMGNTYAPVVKTTSLRTLLAVAAMNKWQIAHYDVHSAYLYGELDQPVYMTLPQGLKTFTSPVTKVCRLFKAIYGLKQSGNIWHKTLSKYLLELGFRQFGSDPCVFSFKRHSSIIIMGCHVDDFLTIYNDEKLLNEAMENVSSKFKLKKLENSDKLLGLEITWSNEHITINQAQYAHEVLHRYGMKNCNGVTSPFDTKQDLECYQDSPGVDSTFYQEIIGSLMYLSVQTRPDLAYSVSYLSKFNNDPRSIHLNALKRILRYVKSTSHYGFKFEKGTIELNCYVDASWRDGKGNQRSTSGFLHTLGGNLIQYTSKTQNYVCLSTCDAELMAMTEAVKQGIFLKAFIEELLEESVGPINVYCDNSAAVQLVLNGSTSFKSNHLVRQVSFLHEKHLAKDFTFNHISSHHQSADFLTKPLTEAKLKDCLKMIKSFITE